MPDHYDVVIVGGGSAGCAAAARLSEDPGRSVLLLEAGADPQPLPAVVADALRYPELWDDPAYAVRYPTAREIDGSIFPSRSGRIMGGGSSVNVMSAPRPTRHDLDSWAALGNPDWSYDKLLPVLKRMEADQDFPDSPIHGADGPIYIQRPYRFGQPTSAVAAAFIERSFALGLPACDDLNGPNPLGVCTSPQNIKAGRRQSTTVAYLDPARQRPNLTVQAEAAVASLDLVGRRVERVVYRQAGQTQTATAGQVALCAGAYHSPQLLLLSGIGPAADLERQGIRPRHDLPGVGQNYQDHSIVYLNYRIPAGRDPAEWDLLPRFRLMVKSDEALPNGNFHIMLRPPIRGQGDEWLAPIFIALLEQRSRGRISLQSRDPAGLPLIQAGLLEHRDDLAAMTWAMEFVHGLVQHPSLAPFYGPLVQPATTDDWANFACRTFDSYHHAAGTCQMGPASNSLTVVDPTLRVHGLDNLWVADASIMPTVVHANTNLTAIMIGERVVDLFQAGGL